MNKIYVISPVEVMAAAKGKTQTYLLFYLGLPIIIVGSILLFIYSDSLLSKTMGLLGVVFFGGGSWFLFRKSEYKPGRSFPFMRNSKERIRSITICSGGICIIILCLFLVLLYISHEKTSIMVYYFIIVGIVGVAYAMYYTINSFEVHEDVDYVSSSEMEKIIGVENDEKIQITYQNFDLVKRNKLKDGCNILMVTDKKIYFAYYKQNHWSYMIKRIEELYRIGYTGTEGDMFLELDFSDETILMLHILVYGKATNNSTLFLKRFLDILDRFMLGSIEGNKTSRRRISMNESTLNKQNNRIEEYGGRKLDINSTVLEGLKEASPVESGRVLEF